ncbi:MAG: prolipoprotein diacylglyceryl transferase [Thermoanaerobaculales bacterium]|nr:prolipoprotein diacylglyceryl transferase [Thermoanaerobaculales bacterium]
MHPVLIDLGFWQIPSYGVLLATAVLVALWTTRIRARRVGLDGDRIVDLALWALIWALLGSKLTLVIVEFPRFFHNPVEILGLARAGGVFLGGFISGMLALIILLRKYDLPPFPTIDTLVPSLSLGQAIGRVGCLAAGCCWGAECNLPWAITYTSPIAGRNLGTPLGHPLHPFPLYAMVANLVIFGLLEFLYRRRPAPGRVFATYLLLYGPTRFLLEFTRGDPARGFVFGGLLSTSQLISIVMILVGGALHLWISRRSRE